MKIRKILSLLLFAISSCAAKDITLYIHGTKFPGIDLKRKMFGGFIPSGLHKASDLVKAHHPHDVMNALCTGAHTFTNKKSLYFFGWDGIFPTQREDAALALFDALMQMIEDEDLQEEFLHIRCLTHSHGGNLAFYLVQYIDAYNAPIILDELVLMGCPIQQMTERFAYSDTIQKIYNLYSNGDDIQQSDPQGLYPEARRDGEQPPLLSRRRFSHDRENLWEIAMRIDGKKIGHQEFIDPIFLLSITQIINQANRRTPGPLHINLVVEEKPIEHINLTIER